MNLPASADDNTPVTGGTVNCSTARDSSGNKHCLWKPKEGDKTGFDQFADERAKLGTGTGGKPAPTPVPKPVATTLTSEGTGTYYSAGGYSFQPYGSHSYTITRGGSSFTITTRPGPGGSGGGRGTAAK